jgi:hypothetical protein
VTSNVTPFPPGGAGTQKPGGDQPAARADSEGASASGAAQNGAARNTTDGASPNGSKTAELASLRERLINDVLTALSLGPYVPMDVYERRCTGVKSAIDQTEPADEIEGMLMAQMLTAHSRGLGFVRMSLTEEFIDERVRCAYILAATRLLSLVRRQAYALARHRDWLAQRERRAKDGRRKPRKKPLRESMP